MIRKLFFITLLFIFWLPGWSQPGGQVVKGQVADAVTQVPLAGATVAIMDTEPQLGTMTDENGKFRLWDIRPERPALIFHRRDPSRKEEDHPTFLIIVTQAMPYSDQ